MSRISNGISQYLCLRRGLGYKLSKHDAVLEKFRSFLDSNGYRHILTRYVREWACKFNTQNAAAQAVGIVRKFCMFYRAYDSKTEIPPPLPHKLCRPEPYIFTDREMSKLISLANTFPKWDRYQQEFMTCLLRLMRATGIRPGEALSLIMEDVDCKYKTLHIRNAKYGGDRILPIDSSLCAVLNEYATLNNRVTGIGYQYLFSKSDGMPFNVKEVGELFASLRKAFKKDYKKEQGRISLVSLRHTFASKTVEKWSKMNVNAKSKLLILSTYLGHSRITSTYRYITATKELNDSCIKKLENYRARHHEAEK